MRTTLGLEDDLGQSVSLKSVRMEGKLEGLLLTMQVSQRYRNDTDDTIEATYTFPAGWGANLLGFSVTLNGKHMQAIALAKKKAEENYEKAITDGDTPVMLEKSPLGLYTASHVTTPEHVYAWPYFRNCLEPVEALQNQKSLACFALVAKRIRGLRVAHLNC